MMKKIIQFILAIIIAVPVLAQGTVELGKVQDAMPGTVDVSLTLSDFTDDVGAIHLVIQYDPDLMVYTGPPSFSLDDIDGYLTSGGGPDNNWLSLTWFNSPGSDFSVSKTINLQFQYSGGFDTELEFVEDHPLFEIADAGNPPLPINGIEYSNGSVEPAGAPYAGTLTLAKIENQVPGATVSIPLNNSTTDAYTADLKIGFDNNLAYVGTSDNNANFNVTYEDGVISLARAADNTSIPIGDVIKLNFTYWGSGDANVRFLPGSFIGDPPDDIFHTEFVDGKVTQSGVFDTTFEIEKVTTVGAATSTYGPPDPKAETVEVTISDDISGIGVITLKIAYDTEKLTYQGYIPNQLSPWSFAHDTEAGVLTFSKLPNYNPGYSLSKDSPLFTLNFDYNLLPAPGELGQADIGFVAGSFLENTDSEPLNIGFEDGWITMGYMLDLKVFLQGPFNKATQKMNTLPSIYSIDLDQPYNTSPWNYTGTESITSVPADVVDWVLVELRDAAAPALATSGTIKWEGALLLKTDGSIVALDGVSLPDIGIAPEENIYAVIRHRNHIPIMSANPMSINGSVLEYDFTDAADKAYQSLAVPTQANLDVTPDRFGMFAGDVDVNTVINFNDIVFINAQRLSVPPLTGYIQGDVQFTGVVNFNDIIQTNSNRIVGAASHIPL